MLERIKCYYQKSGLQSCMICAAFLFFQLFMGESFGVILLETIASREPIVAPRVCDICEIIKNKKSWEFWWKKAVRKSWLVPYQKS